MIVPSLLDWYWYGETTGGTTYVPVVQTTSATGNYFSLYSPQTASLTQPGVYYQDHQGLWYAQAQQHAFQQTAQAYANQAFAYRPPLHLADGAVLHRPAIQRSQADLLARDREAYAQALRECNEQEATRLQRIIQERELASAAERERAAERMRRFEEDQRRRHAAQDRAEGLLLEHLTPDQRETYTRNGWFIVEGGKSKTLYRIRKDPSLVANVDVFGYLLEKPTHRLCAHPPSDAVPLGDHLLAQKIMLELAEDDFLRVANRHPVRGIA